MKRRCTPAKAQRTGAALLAVLGAVVLAGDARSEDVQAQARGVQPVEARAEEAQPKSRFGGHVGLAVPIVTVDAAGDAKAFEFDNFALPVGITFKNVLGPLAFDFELVPSVTTHGDWDLTIHPGIIYPGRHGAIGLRAAVEADGDSYGFTPLVARPLFQIDENATVFLELDAPVRFLRGGGTAYGAGLHAGIGF